MTETNMTKRKSVILYINTSDNKKVEVTISVNGKKTSKVVPNVWTSQLLLPMIDEMLKKHNIKLEQLTEIKINEGPGSYTGLRVGAAVANTLSYLLKIPVNGKKEKLVIPQY